MWRRVELKNYRSIAHVAVDLAPLTVLVGPNGSGKSNFADALVFARDVADDAAAAVERRGGITSVRRWSPGKPTDITIDVRAAKSAAHLDMDYVRHKFKIRATPSRSFRFSHELIESVTNGAAEFTITRKGDAIGGERQLALPGFPEPELSPTASAMLLARQLRAFSRSAALRNVRRIRLEPEAMRLPHRATETTRLDESGANIAFAYQALKQTARREVIGAMQKIVPGLTDIRVDTFERFLLLKFAQRQAGDVEATFSGSEMSDGALRALGILVAAQQMTREELLVIEEPEVSIHVGAAQLLFEVLKQASRRGAVLITTHSADLLDAARDEEILVCSYRDGVTRIGPLASAQRDAVRQGLFSVAELMRSEPLRIEGEPLEAAEP